MRITKIKVKNFRLLKDISVDLEKELSLIIGKNNCGKTSLLLILDKFLGGSHPVFSFDDFNVELKDRLKKIIEADEQFEGEFPFLGISLKLFIEYDDNDNLANVGNTVLTDLDPDNNKIILAFEYKLTHEKLQLLKTDFLDYSKKRKEKADNGQKKKVVSILEFLTDKHATYFSIAKKSVAYDVATGQEDDEDFFDIDKSGVLVNKIINFKWISARRNVSNKEADKSLSGLSLKIYQKLENTANKAEIIEDFKDALTDTDADLNAIYQNIFDSVIADVKTFGGVKPEDTVIKVISTLQQSNLLEKNTTVVYGSNDHDHSLPESYNGLGYMNLISMIFELKILIHEFQREKDERPADINLLFIEEPEVHTHPQMQAVFIKNIKMMLRNGVTRDDGQKRALQTVITTHSSHIVSESDFHDIKYFQKKPTGVVSKNLRDLEAEYKADNQDGNFRFLKQYLTLQRAELFFADKAIFIEGDTERILLPAMMKKIDQQDTLAEAKGDQPNAVPLHSQNISIIDVGAYSHIFEKFIDFLGIKFLVITDLDAVKSTPRVGQDGQPVITKAGAARSDMTACAVSNGSHTANSSLAYFFGGKKALADFLALKFPEKIISKGTDKLWKSDGDGRIAIAYQTEEVDAKGVMYNASSFEDAFLHINRDFIRTQVDDGSGDIADDHSFTSLVEKHLKTYLAGGDPYDFARDGIRAKPSFAIEVLLNSNTQIIPLAGAVGTKSREFILDFSNWNIPGYISEGLGWLKRA